MVMTTDCQQLKPGQTFQQWTEYAERKIAAGERQRWCLTCERWKFADEMCSEARTISDAVQDSFALLSGTDDLPLFEATE